jgi:predicted Zn-dependent protease
MYAKDQTLGLGSYSTDGLDFYRGELSIKESYSSLKENQKFGVIAHELGHVIGLGHVAAKNDIMYPENSQDVAGTFSEEVTGFFNEHPGCSNG